MRARFFSAPFVVAACLAYAGCAGAETPKVQTLDSGGLKIAYSVQGQGEPVVLIHGWLSSANINWSLPGTSARLAKDFQVIALDVRGHGASDKPTDEDAYGQEMMEDVVWLLDHLKIERAHIVGYSMGGIIAANLASRHPERVRSLTLGGMAWLKTGGAAQWLFARIGRDDPDAKARTVCGRSLAKLALTEDEIKAIDVPVTVLVGKKDNLIKRLYVTPLQKVRDDWPVIEIDDANHINCILKEQFQDEIAAALKRHATADPPQ
ncbi:MAG TPA: alpha/beta hydrolase [Pirellulales bacterium]|nr:alpha/beta hydrolase [Pirellulales bacterium]